MSAWHMALDEHFDTTCAKLTRVGTADTVAHWRGFVIELAHELALFSDARDAETLSEALLAIVADALSRPAIAA